MRIGEIARSTCVSRSILRYYEEIGLIPPAGRDVSGYRNYTEADMERIRLVAGARAAGLSVGDIREILEMQDEGAAPCARLLEHLERRAREVGRRIDRLRALESQLRRLRDLAASLSSSEMNGRECTFHR